LRREVPNPLIAYRVFTNIIAYHHNARLSTMDTARSKQEDVRSIVTIDGIQLQSLLPAVPAQAQNSHIQNNDLPFPAAPEQFFKGVRLHEYHLRAVGSSSRDHLINWPPHTKMPLLAAIAPLRLRPFSAALGECSCWER